MQIAIVLGLLVVTIGLFATEKLSVDVVTLLVVIILTLTRYLLLKRLFQGSAVTLLLSSLLCSSSAVPYRILGYLITWVYSLAGSTSKIQVFCLQ
jgi:spore germination protein GerM